MEIPLTTTVSTSSDPFSILTSALDPLLIRSESAIDWLLIGN